MDDRLIKEFRNKINEDGMALQIFREHKNRNKWSIICSAMDWIEVTVGAIDVAELSRDNDNQASVKMITFLSCIDTMWEAISQLHRVLFSVTDIPFKDDRSIFNQNVPDNIYFKTIRGCFAAHQINMKEVFPDDSTDERWFASWSGGTFSRNDFSVFMYSNLPEKEMRAFEIQFSQLMQFAEKRYQYLNELMVQFDIIVEKYKEDFRKQSILTKGDIEEKIDLLLQENEKRLRCDYYDYELREIRLVCETEIHEVGANPLVVEEYKMALLPKVDEIQKNLQDMVQEELKMTVDDECPYEYLYPFSKLSDSVWGQGYAFAVRDWIVETLQKYSYPIVQFNQSMSLQEIYVLFKAACYKKGLLQKE